MSLRFEHETLGQRVRFAPGGAAAAVREEVERLGATRIMTIASPDRAALAEQVTDGQPGGDLLRECGSVW